MEEEAVAGHHVYFSEKPSNLTSESHLARRGKVLAFKEAFPEEGLYWPYKGQAEFVKYANGHLRKFVHEYAGRGGSAAVKAKAARESEAADTYTLNVGHTGAVTLPRALLRLLNMSEGDRLQLRVADNRIVSGIGVSKDQPFDPNVVSRLHTRLRSSPISMTPSKLRDPLSKGRRNG